MSAERLREAADRLDAMANQATPGPWSAANEHGLLGPDADAAWCVSQMRPGHESMTPTEGYVTDVADVWGDDRDANPDAAYIAAMHPGVGKALAAWLRFTADVALFPSDPVDHEALAVANAILGGTP